MSGDAWKLVFNDKCIALRLATVQERVRARAAFVGAEGESKYRPLILNGN